MEIRRAKLEDAHKVQLLSRERTIEGDKSKGFLASNYEVEIYEEAILKNQLYVLVEKEEIRGFLFVYKSSELTDLERANYEYTANNVMGEYFIVKQVYSNIKGGGTFIYDNLKNINKEKLTTIAIILTNPLNQTSINFHEKCGFEKMNKEKLSRKNGIEYGIWKKEYK